LEKSQLSQLQSEVQQLTLELQKCDEKRDSLLKKTRQVVEAGYPEALVNQRDPVVASVRHSALIRNDKSLRDFEALVALDADNASVRL